VPGGYQHVADDEYDDDNEGHGAGDNGITPG
jgi:hypothetical protein